MSTINLKSKYQKFAFEGKEGGYVTRAVTYSRITSKNFLKHVARNSGVSKGALYAAADAIAKEFQNLLLIGHSVEIPEIGTFRVSISAKSAETADQAGAHTVYRRRVLYHPCVDIKEQLNDVEFVTKTDTNDDQPVTPGNENNG